MNPIETLRSTFDQALVQKQLQIEALQRAHEVLQGSIALLMTQNGKIIDTFREERAKILEDHKHRLEKLEESQLCKHNVSTARSVPIVPRIKQQSELNECLEKLQAATIWNETLQKRVDSLAKDVVDLENEKSAYIKANRELIDQVVDLEDEVTILREEADIQKAHPYVTEILQLRAELEKLKNKV